jgi:predicted SprT family Zn-dependent metalloprotease
MLTQVPHDMLLKFFNNINSNHFNGFLDPPLLCWNKRLRASAGRFISGRRFFLGERPPKIEIASYLLNELNSLDLIKDTLAHEMIHYWLWVRRRPYGHTAEFWKKMTAMGVSRYNPVPKLRPYRYLYWCDSCNKKFPARRRLGALACLACCKQYSNGSYDPRFKLKDGGLR